MRWTMFPPILPRPTKPSCITELLLESGDGAGEVAGGQPHARCGEAVAAQGLQVAVGLRVVHELEEAPRRRAALVELAGRVQEARAVAPRGRDAVALDQRRAQAG